MHTLLDISVLYHKCDSSLLSFSTTEELELLEQPLGQSNALEAIEFGTEIEQEGYNLFAMGPSGIGKHSAVMVFLKKKTEGKAVPSDWCYVNNFKEQRAPIATELSAGKAVLFRDDIDELVELFKAILPAAIESSTYLYEREMINQKYIDAQADIFKQLQKEALKHDVSMSTSSASRVTFVPVIEGKILTSEEFKAIKGKKKEERNRKMGEFELIVKEGLRKVGDLNKAQQLRKQAAKRKNIGINSGSDLLITKTKQ